jgi:hypothetical protein
MMTMTGKKTSDCQSRLEMQNHADTDTLQYIDTKLDIHKAIVSNSSIATVKNYDRK